MLVVPIDYRALFSGSILFFIIFLLLFSVSMFLCLLQNLLVSLTVRTLSSFHAALQLRILFLSLFLAIV